ncbi:uncharacterized protein LOC124275684 [Haliotis rubra]|uniref:uncharacterized protein LOC124275684 n=1 Tax=Haliotis rubra TaxID=36100 RepID=UPI001EE5F11F|nr:uncharacterized protein LOC124275684 [Haliotis rubra]
MTDSFKRPSEVAGKTDNTKRFEPTVTSVSRDELMKTLDADGLKRQNTTRCKVSDLPKNLLLEIISYESIKIHDEDVWKVLLSPSVKKEALPSEYDVLLNTQYTEAVGNATHMIFAGQNRSKNNRLFNKIKFFCCVEDDMGEEDETEKESDCQIQQS